MPFFPRFHFITSLNTHTSRLRRPGNWCEQQPGCVLFVPHPCDWNWFLKIMPYRIRSNCCRIVKCSVSNCDPGRWLSKCLALFLNGCFRLLWVCLRSPLQGYHPRYNLNWEDCFFWQLYPKSSVRAKRVPSSVHNRPRALFWSCPFQNSEDG